MFKAVKSFFTLGIASGLAGLAGPPVLAGQGFEVTPFVGLYFPTAKVLSETATSGSTTVTVGMKHNTQFLFGGRLTYWFNPRVGVEGAFGYTPSSVTISASVSGLGSASVDSSAHVLLGSARVLYKVGPKSGDTEIHLLAGVSFVSRGGAAYSIFDSTSGTQLSGLSDVGGVIGASVRFHAGRSLRIRVDIEDNLYSTQFELAGSKTQSQFQNDIALSLGLAIPM